MPRFKHYFFPLDMWWSFTDSHLVESWRGLIQCGQLICSGIFFRYPQIGCSLNLMVVPNIFFWPLLLISKQLQNGLYNPTPRTCTSFTANMWLIFINLSCMLERNLCFLGAIFFIGPLSRSYWVQWSSLLYP